MWRWLRDLLYGEEHAEFPCPYPPEVAIQRLRNVTSGSVLDTLFRESAIGRIAADRIVLRRHRPWFHNDFRPTFVGRLLVEDGHTLLRGGFRLGAYPKVLMTIWLGELRLIFRTPWVGAIVASEVGHGEADTQSGVQA